jgi:CheY-like chemotaxis protein
MIKKFTRVLLVDDNEIDNVISHSIIKNMDIADDIVAVKNGKEALDYIDKSCNSGILDKHNLIFLDINMPIMDGFEFLEEFFLYQKKEGFTIIMLSSSRDHNDKIKCLKLNAAGYLEKPISTEKINYILKKLAIL